MYCLIYRDFFTGSNKYFTIKRMPVVASQYWNGVHGLTPEDVKKDEEGLQTMRTLGYNMAWMLKAIAYGGQKRLPYRALPENKFHQRLAAV